MSFASEDRRRELTFIVGTLVGMTATAFGFALLILALSVGVRRGEALFSEQQKTIIVAVGMGLTIAALLARLYRDRLPIEDPEVGRRWGKVGIVAGVAITLVGVAAETNVSAPFLSTTLQKYLLFVFAYGLLGGGYAILRYTARRVGW